MIPKVGDVVAVRTSFYKWRLLRVRIIRDNGYGDGWLIGSTRRGVCHRAWIGDVMPTRPDYRTRRHLPQSSDCRL